MEGFEYVITRQKKQKICFGSALPRDMSRTNSFMKYYTKENYSNISPGIYDISASFNAIHDKPSSKSISKKGYSGIARFGSYLEGKCNYPSAGNYEVCSSKFVKKSKYPFNSSTKMKTFVADTNPGPGIYKIPEKRRIKFEHSFGGPVKMRLGVQLKCCNANVDICKICEQTPQGDYWHWKNKIFLCRPCMTNEFEHQTKYKRKELKSFCRVRDCSDIHRHERTGANVWLIHPKLVLQKIRKETYLISYLAD